MPNREGPQPEPTRRWPAVDAPADDAEQPVRRRFTTEDLLLQLEQEAAVLAEPPAAAPTKADEAAYLAELARDLGMEDVLVFKSEGGPHVALDRRGTEHFDPVKLSNLPPVVRAVTRGRAGMLLHATAGGPGNVVESTALNPIAVSLLSPGDGVAEALLAVTATTTFILDGRVAGRLSDHLSRSSPPETISAYGGLHAKMAQGLAVTLAALAKIRALRKDWDSELQLTHRRTDDGDHVQVEPRAAH